MVDAEAALAAELQESKRRADELQALLDAERRRAAEAETKLKERERLLKEAQRKPVDKELADKQRAVLSQVPAYACRHARPHEPVSTASAAPGTAPAAR
jgi:hypothetical protein